MRTLLSPIEITSKLAPKASQMPESGMLRSSQFVVEENVPEGTLLYNTLTKQLVLVEKGELKNAEAQAALWEGLFLVGKDADELKTSRQVSQLAQLLAAHSKGIDGYTILPTTDCNARCFYCFELKRTRLMMSKDTADKVARYIIDHRTAEKKVKIRWFGGEPLYNAGAIDRITERLTAAGVEFTSTMVSNGYLFTEKLVAKASEKWKVRKIQITLDGTEATYNKTKAYVKCDGSPYQRVIRNIMLLADAGIKVSIRLNIDKYNITDMFALVRELSVTFVNKEKISIYSHMLFEQAGAQVRERSDKERAQLYEQQQQLERLILDNGFCQRDYHLMREVKLNHCMADNEHSVVIQPDGHIGKCEHYTDTEHVGHIDNNNLDAVAVKSFKERWQEQPECATCAVYPECIRLKKCQENSICHPEDQHQRLKEIKKAMLSEYNKLKQQTDENK